MFWLKKFLAQIVAAGKDDEKFLQLLKRCEGLASRILALAMLVLVFSLIYEVCWVLFFDILTPPVGRIGIRLIDLFGLFLNVLIALEILENITAYLKTHVSSQIVELVVVTALVAVARKLIILDVGRPDTIGKLVSLAIAIFSLSISYWIVHSLNRRQLH